MVCQECENCLLRLLYIQIPDIVEKDMRSYKGLVDWTLENWEQLRKTEIILIGSNDCGCNLTNESDMVSGQLAYILREYCKMKYGNRNLLNDYLCGNVDSMDGLI